MQLILEVYFDHIVIRGEEMLFVTVGTHEQQFNRLVEYMDHLARDGQIAEEVIIQTGFSTYIPRHCKWSKLFPYSEMQKYIQSARIVITHGGPSSFIAPLQIGKIPIVVPRKKEFGEHVNDHQVRFCRQVAGKNGNIIVVESIDDLGGLIKNYEGFISGLPTEMKSNNLNFCNGLRDIVEEIMQEI